MVLPAKANAKVESPLPSRRGHGRRQFEPVTHPCSSEAAQRLNTSLGAEAKHILSELPAACASSCNLRLRDQLPSAPAPPAAIYACTSSCNPRLRLQLQSTLAPPAAIHACASSCHLRLQLLEASTAVSRP